MAVIGSLSVKLGLVTLEWDQASAKAKKQAKDLQNSFKDFGKEVSKITNIFGGLTNGMNLTAIGAMALGRSAMSLSAQIKDVSESLGISTSKVLEYRAAFAASGVSADNATKILTYSFRQIAEAQEGLSLKLIGNFEKIGISWEELSRLTPEKALERLAQGLQGVEDKFERAKFIKAFLGKSAGTFTPESFMDAMGKVNGTFDETAESIMRLAEVDNDIKQSLENLKLAFGEVITPFLGQDGLIISIEKFKIGLIAIGSVYVISKVVALGTAMWGIYSALRAIAWTQVAITMGTPGMQVWAASLGAALAMIGLAAKSGAFDEYIDKLAEIFGFTDKLKGQNIDLAKPPLSLDSIDVSPPRAYTDLEARLAMAKEELEYQKELSKVKVDAIHVDEFTTKHKEAQLKLTRDIAKLESDRSKELSKAETVKEEELINKIYQKRIELAQEAYIMETKLNDQQRAIQQDWVEGWNNAFEQYLLNAKNYGEMGAEAFNGFVQNMEDAIDKFVETGKLRFGDLARSIIQDIIKIQLKAQASKLLSMAGDYLGSIFGFADGGNPPVGQASLVGERGPELFIPKTAGTIIPNHQLGSAMGNSPQVVYNGPYIANMSAIDTQSATQFLAKNKTAVWSANQSAQRSLPQSR